MEQSPHDPPRYYAIRLTKSGPRVPAKVWYGQPTDPHTGEPMDRAERWQATINGEPVDYDRVVMVVGNMGYIKGELIDEAEYEYLLSVRTWAVAHAPDDPAANPREKIDLNRLKPIF